MAGLAGAAATWPLGSGARTTDRVRRIGWLSPTSAVGPSRILIEKLGELGYEPAKNLLIESRWAEGGPGQLPELAEQLARSQVEVIVTWGYLATAAAQRATNSTPIVFLTHADPVEAGFVASLGRPTGNLTGLTFMNPELVGKRLEFLKSAAPGIDQVTILVNTQHPGVASIVRSAESAAALLGLEVNILEVPSAETLDAAMGSLSSFARGGLYVFLDPLFVDHRIRIAELAVTARIPAIYDLRQFSLVGGLMSYGPRISDLLARAARYVDQVLDGATPAALPVEQPTRFELVINLKTAKALGLTFPPTLLTRADEVIE